MARLCHRALALLMSSASALGAQRVEARGDPRIEVEAAFGVSGSTELRTVVMTSPLMTVSSPITERTAFVWQWGFTVATGEPTSSAFDSTYLAVGNPLIGFAYLAGEGLVFTPSLTLPVARRPEAESRRPASVFALDGGPGLRGAADPWLWRPDQITLVLPLAWVFWIEPFLFETHVKLGIIGPTDGREGSAALQLKLRVAVELGASLWLAAGVTGVFGPTEGGADKFQGAVAPELRYVIGPGSHAALTLMMNIDEPFGPFTRPGRFWGVLIGGSAPF